MVQKEEKIKHVEAKLKEKEITDRAKDTITKKDQEITALNTKVENIAKQVESEKFIQSQRMEADLNVKLEACKSELAENIMNGCRMERKIQSFEEENAKLQKNILLLIAQRLPDITQPALLICLPINLQFI